FRLAVRALCDFDHLPDYSVSMEDDMVSFRNRTSVPVVPGVGYTTKLRPDTLEAARLVAPGWDIYVIEMEWREWVVGLLEQGMEPPRNADNAFIGFCKKWAARHA
ncbi:MAG: hypothetical protein RLQ73_17935, partial [Hoeflea sp. D1-CHI-28]